MKRIVRKKENIQESRAKASRMRVKYWMIGILCMAIVGLTGCAKALETASDKFDDIMANLLPDHSGEYEENGKVSIRILTPSPTPEFFLTPTPTPEPTPTPDPEHTIPVEEAVNEWVFAASAVNIRAGWSTKYSIVGGLVENDCVHRVAILDNGWSKISYNGEYVYVNSSYLTKDPPNKIGTFHLDTMEYTYNAIFNGEDVVMLGVKNILQKPDLPAGAEITSLAIVLQYLGYNIDKVTLAENYLTTAEPGTVSPFEAYLGDPRSASGSYGCYAPVIVNAANQYFEDRSIKKKALDASGSTLEELLGFVQKGTPVIVWATTNNLAATKLTTKWEIDGEIIQWRGYEHCMVLIGYNKTQETVVMADPQRGIVEYDMNRFYTRYLEQYESAVIITNK